MKKENDLGRDEIGALVWRTALPSMLAQFVSVLYSIVDRMYIGHIAGAGETALAGVGVCGPVVTMVGSAAVWISWGASPLMGIRMGEGRPEEARRILRTGFCMLLAFSLAMMALVIPLREPMLRFFGASDATYPYADAYFTVYLTGTVFALLAAGLNQMIIAQGFAAQAMRLVVLGAALNIALDPVFIFALGMGVRGAALATILSQGLSCVWVLRFLTGKRTLLRLRRENFFIPARLLLPCISLGLATFVMQASESVISVCFNSSLLKYGDDIAVGAMTILSSVMQFAMLPLQGIAQGAQPITSYNYGARNTQRVRKTFRLLLKVCLCYSVALWAVIQLCPGAFARIFTPNVALVAFTVPALRIYCGALFLFGIQIACQMTFVSIGAAGCSIIVAVLRKFVLLLPLIYLMPRLLADQTMAVYTAEPVADAIAVTCTAILFAVQFRKALRKLDAED